MWQVGLFDRSTNLEVLSAVLVLLGLILTQLLVGAGLVLKHAIDLRTYRISLFEQERLRVDTVIKAVALLSTSEGRPSAPVQQAGALQAMAGAR